MIGRPQVSEAAPYYFLYIDQAPGDNPAALIETIVSAVRERASMRPGGWRS